MRISQPILGGFSNGRPPRRIVMRLGRSSRLRASRDTLLGLGFTLKCLSWVIHDRCIQYPRRSMSVVTPIDGVIGRQLVDS